MPSDMALLSLRIVFLFTNVFFTVRSSYLLANLMPGTSIPPTFPVSVALFKILVGLHCSFFLVFPLSSLWYSSVIFFFSVSQFSCPLVDLSPLISIPPTDLEVALLYIVLLVPCIVLFHLWSYHVSPISVCVFLLHV